MAHGKSDEWQMPLIDYSLKYAGIVKRYYKQYLIDYNKGLFK